MYCKNCGAQIDDKAAVCVHCGVAVRETAQQAQQPTINIVNSNNNQNYAGGAGYIHKKKWTAFWLCFFLGGLGVHRFYVGKTGTGIIWLLTAGLFGVGSLIDLIVILCGGFRDKAGQPLL